MGSGARARARSFRPKDGGARVENAAAREGGDRAAEGTRRTPSSFAEAADLAKNVDDVARRDRGDVAAAAAGAATAAGSPDRRDARRGGRCDACVACDDRCRVPGCASCGGPVANARADLESGDGGGDDDDAGGGAGENGGGGGGDGWRRRVREAIDAAADAAADATRAGWGRRDAAAASETAATARDERERVAAARTFTCCQVNRHRDNASMWLVANGDVFDVTDFLLGGGHPVGPRPVLRGRDRDNTEDAEMHSAKARRAWRKLKIGTLAWCPKRGFGGFKPPRREGAAFGNCAVS